MTLRTLNYRNCGIFLIMGNAGFCPSTVSRTILWEQILHGMLNTCRPRDNGCKNDGFGPVEV